MQQIIEQLALEAGVSNDDARNIFIGISSRLVNKIPALEKIIEDVFEDTADDIIKDDINKLILQLQEQQFRETFNSWIMPKQVGRIITAGSNSTY